MESMPAPSRLDPGDGLQSLDQPPPTGHLVPPPRKSHDASALVLLIGSFSPITNMHLRLLELARDHLSSSGVHVAGGYISPTADAYHKPHLAPTPHRLAMAHLAVADASCVAVDDWEANHSRFVRTHEVVARLKAAAEALGCGPAEVFLVCGADLVHAMADGRKWPAASVQRPFETARVLWVRRGDRAGDVFAKGGALERYAERSSEVHGFCWSLSSTLVRKCVENEQSILYMTPTPVVKYIREHRLFREVGDSEQWARPPGERPLPDSHGKYDAE